MSSRNSEAFTSELLENIEEMFPRYYMNSYQQNIRPHTVVLPVLVGGVHYHRITDLRILEAAK